MSRYRFIPLLIIGIALLVLAGCGSGDDLVEPEELVYGLTLVPSGIDPHIHASAELGIPLRSVYDTLVYREHQLLRFVPGLAEEWTVSDDGLTYTFTLRQGVRFHDGTPFDAEAVRVNLERVLNPDTGSQKAVFMLGPVERVEVLDEYEVAIVLSTSYPPLLDSLSQPYLGMASPTALAEYDNATYQFHQVGTGPYRFVEYLPGDELVLERNPDYAWGSEVLATDGLPAVERIIFRFYEDPAARALALEGGDVQVMGELLPTDAQDLSEYVDISTMPVSIPGQPLQFMLNTARPPTNRLAVREALLLGTDRPTIVQTVFQGLSPVAHGPISSATLDYNENLEGQYAYQPVEAKAILDEIELVDSDGDGWRDFDDEPVVITIIVPPWGLTPETAQLLEAQWETTLQFQVEVRQVAGYGMLREEVEAGEYHVISFNNFGLDPILLNSFYTSTGFNNWGNISDPDLDALLLQAAVQNDPDRRNELYARAQERIMDQAYIIPIREYTNLNGVSSDVSGLHYDAQGWFPYLADLTLRGAIQ
jgi:peptide/nickel transport system substrate-binding protein